MPRFSRVTAVARRDLRIELGNRRGWVLPGALALFLGPLATAPGADALPIGFDVWVRGDVPQAVLDAPGVRVRESGRATVFRSPAPGTDGPLVVRTRALPEPLRAPLDAMETRVAVVHYVADPLDTPERSLLFALISASVLTGAIAQSLPGERSARTLETLRTAAITPLELVVGKWAAWAGLGALGGVLATLGSLAFGRQSFGPWVFAVPWGALVTVALGLWFVRRAEDVVGGATVAVRTLPVVLALTAALSWYLGMKSPWLGALVPVGGPLIAAGNTWAGWGPVLLSIAVSAATCGLLLTATARDLGDLEGTPQAAPWWGALGVTALAATVVWFPLLAPMLWTLADRAERTAAIPLTVTASSSAWGLALLAALLVLRAPRPERFGLRSAAWPGLALGGAVGLGVWGLGVGLPGGLALPGHPVLVADALQRLRAHADLTHVGLITGLAAIAAQEVTIRGWVQSRVGVVGSTAAWVLVARLGDPVLGLLEGLLLAGLRHRSNSVVPSLVARTVVLAVGWAGWA